MASKGSEGSVEAVNSADVKAGSGKGLEQYSVEEITEEGGGGQPAATEGETQNGGGETNLNEDNSGNVGESQNPQEGKVFVGGISWQTTEESLQYYFQRFGEVADVVMMRDKITGNPRGFGFVRFSDPSVAERVLQEQHSIDGRHIDVKIAVPRDGSRQAGGGMRQGGMGGGTGGRGFGGSSSQGQDSYKIFVGGLDQSVSDPEFRSYFEQFGAVTDSVVMYDKKTSRSRGFGFITFADSAPMMDALCSSHSLNGKPVEVKEASPREYHGGGGGGMGVGPRAGSGGGRDFQRGGPGGYGMGGYPTAGYGFGGYAGYGGPAGGYGGAPGGYGGGYGAGYDGSGYGGGGYGGSDWSGLQGGWGGWQGGWGGWGGGGYGASDGSGQGGATPPQGDQTGSGYGSGNPGGQVPSDYGRQGGGQGGYGPQGPARAQHNRADRSYRPY